MRRAPIHPLIGAVLLALANSSGATTPMTININLPGYGFMTDSADGALNASANARDNAHLASNTAKILQNIPGGSVSAAGGVSRLPVLNGLSDNQLLLQVNGFSTPNACANHMNPPLSYLPPAAIGQITIYSTVVPVSVGGNAIGGAVIVKSPQPIFAKTGSHFVSGGSVGGFYQSNGNIYGTHLNAAAATRHFSINYSGSYVHGGNYTAAKAFKPETYGIPGDVVASSLYEAVYQNLNAAYRWKQQVLELGVQYQSIPYQGFPSARMDMTGNHSTRLNLHYQGRFQWGELELQAYNQVIQHNMNFLADKNLGAMMGMPMNTQGVNNGVKGKIAVPLDTRNRLEFGASYNHEHLNDWWPPATSKMSMIGPNTYITIDNGRRDRYAAFADLKTQWDPQWNSDLGLRLEDVRMNSGPVQGYNAMMYGNPDNPQSLPGTFNRSDRQRQYTIWNFSAIVHYQPDKHSSYTLGLARKAQAPSLYELYPWSSNAMAMNMIGWFNDGNGYIGNLNLKPETANTVSLAANFHGSDPQIWHVQIQPYFTYIHNYIGAVRCPTSLGGACTAANLHAESGFVYLQFANQTAEIWGINMDSSARLAQTRRYGTFTMSAKAAYVRGDNLSNHTPLYHMMPLNLRLALHQNWGAWRNTIEEQLVAAKNQVDALRNEPQTAGYGLLNLRTAYRQGHWQASLELANLLNQFYEQSLGGLYLGQRPMTYGTALPGSGRSVNMSLQYQF
ncbi:TonB-dependent receptor [Acidithiobacillus thiooxidans]|uniref:TonB-dependent receptor n=1 Tax=Acidithiobacillus thiooxidans TaxID=930 RepID=UPI00285A17DA|nr:TonB-dependent receptor [Acidithiobacillus thiooxidans]MDR7928184.1 TonB-dependent receptor [Acidithiobacillus thiooxidans]